MTLHCSESVARPSSSSAAATAERGRRTDAVAPVGAAADGRRLVVHAGTSKTGSTTLQRALAALDPVLRPRGVHVPMAARISPGEARHANLFRRFTGFRYAPEKGAWCAVVEEILASEARLFVISDERFSGALPGAVLAAIGELAARCDLAVDVVGYVRPQYQYLESLYSTAAKGGFETAPFEVWAAHAFAGRPVARHPQFNYALAFGRLRARLGARVAVTPLEPSRLEGGLVAHFLGLLGVGDLAGAAPQVRANTRVGAKELEVCRLTTVALRGAGRREAWRAVKRLHRLPELLPGDRPFTGLSAAGARSLMDRFAAANAAFAREFGISAEGVLFEGPGMDELVRPTVAQWEDLTPDEQRAVREYVRNVGGVDPAPRSGCGAGRRRGARGGGSSWLGRVRRDAPIGSPRWRAAWLSDWRILRGLVGALVRRARARLAARLAAGAVFDGDGAGPARDR